LSGDLLAVGRIGRAHGVHGEVAVRVLSEVESRFETGSTLFLGPDADRSLTVRAARPHHGRLLVSFEEVGDRTEAELLTGRLLLVPPETSPPLDDAYWEHQVVGLEVSTEQGRVLGRVREVLHNPANDIWVVENGGEEILLPAIREVVTEVDVEGGRVVIREAPGLIAGWEEA
jgi:16S rRNA processing protein RimM